MIAPTGRLALYGHSTPNASWGVYCQQFVGHQGPRDNPCIESKSHAASLFSLCFASLYDRSLDLIAIDKNDVLLTRRSCVRRDVEPEALERVEQ
jgi:hypothetical protein